MQWRAVLQEGYAVGDDQTSASKAAASTTAVLR
jgi:hypothetical protein